MTLTDYGTDGIQLDASQRAFCEAPDGNVRLLAPAGCGKTLSLLHRCNSVASRRTGDRARFLIITFTRAARDELWGRLHHSAEFAALRDLVEINTLNAWGYRRLKLAAVHPRLITTRTDYHFTVLNLLQPVWTKYDNVRSAIERGKHAVPKRVMDLIDAFKAMGYDHTRHRTESEYAARTDEIRRMGLERMLKQTMDDLVRLGILSPVIDLDGDDATEDSPQYAYQGFYRFWLEAVEHLRASAVFTIEDQKYVAYLDERNKLEAKQFLSGAARYSHVLVDEFQDINPLDLALIHAIVARNRASLTVVGDDDQAIFEWRGATPRYILEPDTYIGKDVCSFTLGINYRSPVNIVEHSQRLIANNTKRVAKDTRAYSERRADIAVVEVEDLADGLDYSLGLIKDVITSGSSPSRVAFIGRKRSQIIPYQIFLASENVAFCAAEDLQIFLSSAFENLLKLLVVKSRAQTHQMRTAVIEDVLDLCSLVKRYPLSKDDTKRLRGHLDARRVRCLAEAPDALRLYTGPLKQDTGGRVSAAMADAIETFVRATTVTETLECLGNHFEGLQADFGRADEDVFYVDPPFEHLADYARRYGNDFAAFVEDIELAKDQLAHVPPFEEDLPGNASLEVARRPVHLMTALRAKGKEFGTVVLLDVNQGIWPNRNAIELAEREAERRVFYVAFTRARERVVMLVSRRIGGRPAKPSQYLTELALPKDVWQPQRLG